MISPLIEHVDFGVFIFCQVANGILAYHYESERPCKTVYTVADFFVYMIGSARQNEYSFAMFAGEFQGFYAFFGNEFTVSVELLKPLFDRFGYLRRREIEFLTENFFQFYFKLFFVVDIEVRIPEINLSERIYVAL